MRITVPAFTLIVPVRTGAFWVGDTEAIEGLNYIDIEKPEALILATKLIEELRKTMPVEDLLHELGFITEGQKERMKINLSQIRPTNDPIREGLKMEFQKEGLI